MRFRMKRRVGAEGYALIDLMDGEIREASRWWSGAYRKGLLVSHFQMSTFQPLTRIDAKDAWHAFLPKTGRYAGSRNHVQSGHNNVSGLSVAIRFRLLLEDEIIEETLGKHAFQQVEKWLQEVCWRRYWKGWLEMRPMVWTNWRRRVDWLKEHLPVETLKRAEAVAAGQSGVACMDAMSRELVSTGYLHNHARMWWASFWVHVERLPWELGADVFFRHLLDADPASNTLSWRWVAGLQTAGKTYLVRLSNLERYGAKYLAEGEEGNERIADDVVTACGITEPDEVLKEPLPKFLSELPESLGRVGVWIHADDLVLEHGPLAECEAVSVAGYVCEPVYREVYGLSEQRIQSLRTVMKDGLARAGGHFGCAPVMVETDDPVEGLVQWAVDQRLEEVVAFAPMVGPIRDLVPRLKRRLKVHGIRLTLIRRATDELAFSFAGAGFFPFWQKMSRHLNQLQTT